MTETNPSLTEFLLARFAEDEAAWSGGADLATRPDFARLSRHMLADVEAKRRIAELHDSVSYAAWCRSCGRPDMPNGAHEWPCATILALAQPYAAHPEFRGEWRQ